MVMRTFICSALHFPMVLMWQRESKNRENPSWAPRAGSGWCSNIRDAEFLLAAKQFVESKGVTCISSFYLKEQCFGGQLGKILTEPPKQPEHICNPWCWSLPVIATMIVLLEAISSRGLLGMLLSPVSTRWRWEELCWTKGLCKGPLGLHGDSRVRLKHTLHGRETGKIKSQ